MVGVVCRCRPADTVISGFRYCLSGAATADSHISSLISASYLPAIGHRLIADMSKAAMIRFTLLDMAVGVSLCPFHHLAIILTCKNSLLTCKNYCKMVKGDAHVAD